MYGVRFFACIFIVLFLFIDKTRSFIEKNGNLKLSFIEASEFGNDSKPLHQGNSNNNQASEISNAKLLSLEQKIDETNHDNDRNPNMLEANKDILNGYDEHNYEYIDGINENDIIKKNVEHSKHGPPQINNVAYIMPTYPLNHKNPEHMNQAHYENPTHINQAHYDIPGPTDQAHYENPDSTDQAHYENPEHMNQDQNKNPEDINQAHYEIPDPTDQAHYENPEDINQTHEIPGKGVMEKPFHHYQDTSNGYSNKVFNLHEDREHLLLGSIIGKDFSIHIREHMIRELILSAKDGIKGIVKLKDSKYVGRICHAALTRLKITPEMFLNNNLMSLENYNKVLSTIFLIMTEISFKEYDFFYKPFNISEKLKKLSLKKLKIEILTKLGVTYDRLPPIIKYQTKECPVKNIIVSISSKELAQRMAIMFTRWLSLEDYGSIKDVKHNVELNVLCSSVSILIQQWKYYQMLLGFEEDNEHAFLNFIDELLVVDKKYSENKEFTKSLKKLKKSIAFQYCTKLMRVAGNISSVPFSHENHKTKSTSLIGSLGNLIKIHVGSYNNAVSKRINSYFIYSQKKNKKNIALKVVSVCSLLHVMNLLYRCSNESKHNLLDLYLLKLNSLNVDGWKILGPLVNLSFLSENSNAHLKEICTPNNPLINENLYRLLIMLSSESHNILINQMEQRGLNSSYFDEEEKNINEEGKLQKTDDNELNKLIFE